MWLDDVGIILATLPDSEENLTLVSRLEDMAMEKWNEMDKRLCVDSPCPECGKMTAVRNGVRYAHMNGKNKCGGGVAETK